MQILVAFTVFVLFVNCCQCDTSYNDIVMKHLHATAKMQQNREAHNNKRIGIPASSRQGLTGIFSNTNYLNGILATVTGVLAAMGGSYLLSSKQSNRRYYPTMENYPAELMHLKPTVFDTWDWDTNKITNMIARLDVPETSFQLMGMNREDGCRQRTICEIEQYLKGKGISPTILEAISNKIPGMKRYSRAISHGIKEKDCSFYYSICPKK